MSSSHHLPAMQDIVGNLRIILDPENYLDKIAYAGYPPILIQMPQFGIQEYNSGRYRLIGAAIHIGLRILESPKSRRTLVEVGMEIVHERRKLDRRHLTADASTQQMQSWVNDFLHRVRANFPDVRLSALAEGIANTIKREGGTDVHHYDPKKAGFLSMEPKFIDTILSVGERALYYRGRKDTQKYNQFLDEWDVFIFDLSASIAHELVYLFADYVIYSVTPRNAPPVVYPAGRSTFERAGYRWEDQVFNGVLDYLEDVNHPLRHYQAGLPVAVNSRNKKIYKIQRDRIRKIVSLQTNGNSFPPKKEANPLTYRQQAETYKQTMDAVRRSGNPYIRPTPDQSKTDSYCFYSFMYNSGPLPQNFAPTIPATPANIIGDQVTVSILPRDTVPDPPPPASYEPPRQRYPELQPRSLQNAALPIRSNPSSTAPHPGPPPRSRTKSSSSSWLCGFSSSSGPSSRGASRDLRPRPAATLAFGIVTPSAASQPKSSAVPPSRNQCPYPSPEYTAETDHPPPYASRPHSGASDASHNLEPSSSSHRGTSSAPSQRNGIPVRSRAKAGPYLAPPQPTYC